MRIEKDAVKSFIYRIKEDINHVFKEVRTLSSQLGELSGLKTADKSNLVAAINEQNTNMDTRNYFPLSEYSGNLSDIMKSPGFRSGIIFHSTQNASDSPHRGIVSFTVTHRFNSLWGHQLIFFMGGVIYSRQNNNGNVGEWVKVA